MDDGLGWARDALAAAQDGARGYHHRNVVVERGGARFVVRAPLPQVLAFDVRLVPERETLALLARAGFPAPRLVARAEDGTFEVHSFVEGTLLHDAFPWSDRLPDWVAPACARTLRRLHALDASALAARTARFARPGDAAGLHRALVAFAADLHERLRAEHGALYDALGVPRAPYARLVADAGALGSAPFALCHLDAHRKNLVADFVARDVTLLDWELAFVADPAYDLAIHLHRMRYAPEQTVTFLDAYAPDDAMRRRIGAYARLERIKSAVGDLARYAAEFRGPPTSRRERLAIHYARKLSLAREVWGATGVPDADDIVAAAGASTA